MTALSVPVPPLPNPGPSYFQSNSTVCFEIRQRLLPLAHVLLGCRLFFGGHLFGLTFTVNLFSLPVNANGT
jgi:hypothetical protein